MGHWTWDIGRRTLDVGRMTAALDARTSESSPPRKKTSKGDNHATSRNLRS